MSKRTKISESKFDEILSMVVPSFKAFNYAVEDFCGYFQQTGNICPFIEADRDPKRQYRHIPNFDIQNCMWMCRWFQKIDLPLEAQKRADYYEKKKK